MMQKFGFTRNVASRPKGEPPPPPPVTSTTTLPRAKPLPPVPSLPPHRHHPATVTSIGAVRSDLWDEVVDHSSKTNIITTGPMSTMKHPFGLEQKRAYYYQMKPDEERREDITTENGGKVAGNLKLPRRTYSESTAVNRLNNYAETMVVGWRDSCSDTDSGIVTDNGSECQQSPKCSTNGSVSPTLSRNGPMENSARGRQPNIAMLPPPANFKLRHVLPIKPTAAYNPSSTQSLNTRRNKQPMKVRFADEVAPAADEDHPDQIRHQDADFTMTQSTSEQSRNGRSCRIPTSISDQGISSRSRDFQEDRSISQRSRDQSGNRSIGQPSCQSIPNRSQQADQGDQSIFKRPRDPPPVDQSRRSRDHIPSTIGSRNRSQSTAPPIRPIGYQQKSIRFDEDHSSNIAMELPKMTQSTPSQSHYYSMPPPPPPRTDDSSPPPLPNYETAVRRLSQIARGRSASLPRRSIESQSPDGLRIFHYNHRDEDDEEDSDGNDDDVFPDLNSSRASTLPRSMGSTGKLDRLPEAKSMENLARGFDQADGIRRMDWKSCENLKEAAGGRSRSRAVASKKPRSVEEEEDRPHQANIKNRPRFQHCMSSALQKLADVHALHKTVSLQENAYHHHQQKQRQQQQQTYEMPKNGMLHKSRMPRAMVPQLETFRQPQHQQQFQSQQFQLHQQQQQQLKANQQSRPRLPSPVGKTNGQSSRGGRVQTVYINPFPSSEAELAQYHNEGEPLVTDRLIESRLIGLDHQGIQLIELRKRDDGPFGFYIATGSFKKKKGIFISRITVRGLFPLVSVGDQILDVDFQPVKGKSLEEVQQLMAQQDRVILRTMPAIMR